MVVTRSSKDGASQQPVKDESSHSAAGETEGESDVAGPGKTGEANDQSETLTFLLKSVETINKTLVDQTKQSAQLAEHIAKMSKVLGQQSLDSDDGKDEAAKPPDVHGAASPAGEQVPPLSPASKHFAKPQAYDGSISWLAFRTQFDSISSIHGWNAEEKLGELVACLRGPALEAFAHFPVADRHDYTQLMNMLEQQFGCGKQEPWFRAQDTKSRRIRNPGGYEGYEIPENRYRHWQGTSKNSPFRPIPTHHRSYGIHWLVISFWMLLAMQICRLS